MYQHGQLQDGSLVNRNVVIDGRRTSVRLEPEMWQELRHICKREGDTIHTMCTKINNRRAPNRSLTSAIRVHLMTYYRSAATEEGHVQAGHGENYVIASRISSDMIYRKRQLR